MSLFKRKITKPAPESDRKGKVNGRKANKSVSVSQEESDGKTPEKEMSFVGHLEELRKRIIIVLVVFAAAFIPAYIYHAKILEFITAPLANKELVFLEVTEPFLVNIKLAFFAAAAVAIPILVYQIITFIKPALSGKIRKSLGALTIVFFILFAGGVAFSYKLMIPVAVNWLLGQGTGLTQILSVNKYVSFIGWFLVGAGIMFEMPLVLLFLIKADIITVAQLRKQWRVVYIVILLLCAVITPDWSPVTMGVLAVPMILLYELALLFARFF